MSRVLRIGPINASLFPGNPRPTQCMAGFGAQIHMHTHPDPWCNGVSCLLQNPVCKGFLERCRVALAVPSIPGWRGRGNGSRIPKGPTQSPWKSRAVSALPSRRSSAPGASSSALTRASPSPRGELSGCQAGRRAGRVPDPPSWTCQVTAASTPWIGAIQRGGQPIQPGTLSGP